ncbi:WYL domain-containing protein [Dactylosporangium sp. NPDC050688]|uniref:helix-turn-helix transcriptional regulator n=1 Tax=Dactylosporangium sp. NPDC050688 TaxID=3157217 RepID=UPI0033E1F955
MNRTDRLYALVEELRAVAPRPRSARWLATRFEVSTRTVERDISALQQSGVPIWVSLGRTGGYALDRSRTLPPLNMTPAEAVAVAVALHRLADTPFHAAARTALHKLLAVMPAADVTRAEDLAARIHLVQGTASGRSSYSAGSPAAVTPPGATSSTATVPATATAPGAASATAVVSPAAADSAVAVSPAGASSAASPAATSAVAIAPVAASSMAAAAASRTAVSSTATAPAASPVTASTATASTARVSPAKVSPILVEAFTTGRVLDIAYADRFGVTTRRQIEPAGYLGGPAGWYLLAWCRLRGDLRSFRIDRIHEVVATAELAARRPLPDRALDIPGHLVRRVAMAA